MKTFSKRAQGFKVKQGWVRGYHLSQDWLHFKAFDGYESCKPTQREIQRVADSGFIPIYATKREALAAGKKR